MVSQMDKTDPDSWFEHDFTPYSAVSDYANEPPRGMTNPPMNLALREVLCKDFVEYGTELEVPYWGTSFVRTSSSTPVSPSQSQTSFNFPRQRLDRGTLARSQLMGSYAENLRSGRVSLKASVGGKVLKGGSIFTRTAPADMAPVQATPVHPPWHCYHPFPHTLRPIDRRGPASLVSPSKSVAEAVTEKEKRSVRFADSPKPLAKVLAEQGPSPVNTEFIKTPSHDKAIQLGKRMHLSDPSGKRPSSEPPGMAKKGKDSGKDGPKDEDDKTKHNNIIDQKELDNRVYALRGMSNLHRAAVKDRFVFGASSAAGDPMVLGASPLSQANPGSWSSDAAFLTKFHNSAIRIVNPSGLEVLKEPTSKRKKKKKKNVDDEEELKMSDSGLFVARYPIDESLLQMKRLKKKAFPEEEEVVQTKQEAIKVKCTQSAETLKAELGGKLLAHLRENGDDAEEQRAALAASGYE